MISKIPDLAASEILCVAINTEQFFFAIDRNHSSILSLNFEWPSINHASSRISSVGLLESSLKNSSILRNRYKRTGKAKRSPSPISSSISKVMNLSRSSPSDSESNKCPIEPSTVYGLRASRMFSS